MNGWIDIPEDWKTEPISTIAYFKSLIYYDGHQLWIEALKDKTLFICFAYDEEYDVTNQIDYSRMLYIRSTIDSLELYLISQRGVLELIEHSLEIYIIDRIYEVVTPQDDDQCKIKTYKIDKDYFMDHFNTWEGNYLLNESPITVEKSKEMIEIMEDVKSVLF